MLLSNLLALAGSAAALPSKPAKPAKVEGAPFQIVDTSAFNNPDIHISKGGFASCISARIPVTASTDKNLQLDITLPKSQTEITEFFVESLAAGSTLAENITKGTGKVGGTWNISATLCTPSVGAEPKVVQLLTHGVGFDKSYWDFGWEYSYVDIAAKYGYATFLYDRLGVGLSDKPDPINVIQAPLQVEIAKALATSLRDGKFTTKKFSKVVGVGHSFGSIITQAITQQYPEVLDAAILTGFSTDLSGQPTFLQALNLEKANWNQHERFGLLNDGFLISSTVISNQIGFFKWPGFSEAVLAEVEAVKQTTTFGELNSLGGTGGPASEYNKPVAVVNGISDLPFCFGNCTYPVNHAEAVQHKLYPKVAKSNFGTHLAPLAGHGLSFHYSSNAAYDYIQKFLVAHKLAGK
ncbi:hypothetical protein Q7P37_001960 [Cladosporium fusiforme]